MPERRTAQQLLEGAYALDTPDDNMAYYRDFAAVYDTAFAESLGYFYPQALARVFREAARQSDTPIADIGCGTGLVADALGLPREQIDGIDISPEMLAVARRKALYRALYQADLTASLDASPLPRDYGAVLSAGTFTLGHLGPDVLRELLRIARPGALFCIGVNSAHFRKQNFPAVLESMRSSAQISEPSFKVIRVYSASAHEHAGDTARILVYRKR